MEDFNEKSKMKGLLPGIFLVVVGGLMLAYKMGAALPWWLFSWPMFLIALGLFIGIRHNFRNPGWFILIIVGATFLAEKMIPGLDFRTYLAPLTLIGLGVFFIVRPKNSRTRRRNNWDSDPTPSNEDMIDTVSIMGGSKTMILSKTFKGGELVNIMGGSEIDLTQADFEGTIIIDSVQIMGGAKIIVPANWQVESRMVNILGGFEDKRKSDGQPKDPNKTLVLEGVNIFGGMELKSY